MPTYAFFCIFIASRVPYITPRPFPFLFFPFIMAYPPCSRVSIYLLHGLADLQPSKFRIRLSYTTLKLGTWNGPSSSCHFQILCGPSPFRPVSSPHLLLAHTRDHQATRLEHLSQLKYHFILIFNPRGSVLVESTRIFVNRFCL